MGPIFIIILGVAVSLLLQRVLPESDNVLAARRMIGSVAGAFIGAWLTGSLLQRASFLSNAPDPLTLLGGVAGAVLGVFVVRLVRLPRRG